MKDPKEIKAEIRQLRKAKKDLRPGSAERLELGHKIKALKQQLAEIITPEPGKELLIAEILRLEAEQKIKPTFESLGIILNKFTEKELQKHIDKLIKKGIK